MEGRFSWARGLPLLFFSSRTAEVVCWNSGKALNKEGSELLRLQLWINAISCWCSLERACQLCCRPSNHAGPAKVLPKFSHPSFCGAKQTVMLVSSKYVFRKAKRAILVPLWQNTEKEIRSGRKGRGKWSICRQWFSTYSVYHMNLELILWCHGAAHSGSFGRMRLLHILHTTLIIWLLREMEVRLPLTVHMCKRATECPSHFLRKSQRVRHVGQQTVLPCFCEGFPSTLHVAFGTWVSELKKSLRERTRSSIQVQSADLWMTSLSEMLDVVITLEYISKERQNQILQVEDKIMATHHSLANSFISAVCFIHGCWKLQSYENVDQI